MIDKQQLIYDLALQCAAISVQRNKKDGRLESKRLESEMLDEFTRSMMRFNGMSNYVFSNALKEIDKASK